MTAVADTARSFDAFARVRSADYTTRYIRLGSGQPVIVVGPTVSPNCLWPELIAKLAEANRLIIPEVQGGEARFTAWLRSFLDGMGLPPITLVATAELCLPALEFALLDPDRTVRLALVPSGSAQETGLASVMTPTSGARTVSMMVIRRETPPAEAIALFERFLRDEMP